MNLTVYSGDWEKQYTMHARPTHAFIKTIVFTGRAGQRNETLFRRCFPWSDVEGSKMSIPENISQLAIEVASEDYEFDVPFLPGEPYPSGKFMMLEHWSASCGAYWGCKGGSSLSSVGGEGALEASGQ